MTDARDAQTGNGLSLHAVMEMQDQLLCADTELDRLQELLSDAVDTLLRSFTQADTTLRTLLDDGAAMPAPADAARDALSTLGSAAKALQFQDMASQLIAFTKQRVNHCAERLAGGSQDGEEQALVHAAPTRPNPVVQDEMDTGFIELF